MAKRKSSSSSRAARKKTAPSTARAPIPVTILSGFLGSGKTTLLKYLLTSPEHQLKIAVIVNDMAELNIDSQTIRRTKEENGGGAIVQTKKEVVSLENGCICCTLRGDLIREIQRIQQQEEFDYVVIESTGIAEPQQVAESFCVDPETQELAGNDESMLWNAARLDTCVTLVDAAHFPQYLSSLKRFKNIFQDGLDDAEEGEGEKSISELMVEQVEFANVLVLNKIDLVSDNPQQLQVTEQLLKSLNPKATIVRASYGKMDLHQILNTGKFNLKDASESRGWLVSLKNGVTASMGEADEYGVGSFVYRARKPFHPQRLHTFLKQFFWFAEEWNSHASIDDTSDCKDEEKDNGDDAIAAKKTLLEKDYGSILRSKGSCWIAGRDDHEIEWTQTGRIIQLQPVAAWLCKKSPDEWEGAESKKDVERIREAHFQGTDSSTGQTFPYPYGDRRQEIVFIGTQLQQPAIAQALDTCLLTNVEMKSHAADLPFGTYPDPLHPLWVPCEGSRTLFLKVRSGQDQTLKIYPGFCLTLQNLALLVHNEDDCAVQAVRVWLDKSDDVSQGVLLATLRPLHHEQQGLSLTLLPCDEDGGEVVALRRLRIQVLVRKSLEEQGTNIATPITVAASSSSSKTKSLALMNACEVHFLGKVEPLAYSPAHEDADAGDGGDENETPGDCSDGVCD